MERETRLELATSSLARRHSTTELPPQYCVVFLLYMSKKKLQADNQKIFKICYNYSKSKKDKGLKEYYSIISPIKNDLEVVDNLLKSYICNENNSLTKNFLDYIIPNSKKIRSAITILAIKSVFNEITPKQLKICAFTELIHNATLIHDDIIDNSEKRRGNETFNKIFGDKTAVISGDFLLSISLKILSDIENNEITKFFASSITNICSGEIEQSLEKNKVPSIEKYLEKSEKKTGELFKFCLISAFLAENQQEYVDFGENFGKNFGIAFQIHDDLMNFSSKNNEKPVNNDIKDGIYTAPVIFYHQKNPDENINVTISDKIINSTTIGETEDLCSQYINKALDLTKDFSDNQYKRALIKLCELLKKG